MTYRIQEVKVGIIVVVSVLLFVFFVLVISGIDFKKDTVIYTTRLTYVGGLEVGTPVRFGGVMVGRIAAIMFPEAANQKIKLVLELERSTPIKQDSRAFLTSIGLLGEFYIEINPGSPEAPLLPPGSEIPALETSTFSQLSTMMGDIATSAESTIVGVNYLLREENQQQITAMLRNTNQLLQSNTRQIKGILANMEVLTRELSRLTSQLNAMLLQNQGIFQNVLHHVDSTLAESQILLQHLNTTMAGLNRLMDNGAPELQKALIDLERTARNLEEFSQRIRSRPWLLVRKSNPALRKLPEK